PRAAIRRVSRRSKKRKSTPAETLSKEPTSTSRRRTPVLQR
ncbi:unnamed protein product, partial [Brassica rapa subsp. narinosa]